MGGLLYKNFFQYRWELLVIAVLQFIATLTVILATMSPLTKSDDMVITSVLMYAMVFFVLGFFESGMFAPDEKRTAMSFIISAPTGAKQHIGSKYLTVLLIYLGVLACCFLTDAAAVAITGDATISVTMPLIIIFSGALFLEALSLPFMVYFGSAQGTNAKGRTLLILGYIIGMYILFGDISLFLEEDFLEAVKQFFTQGNIILILGIFPYIALALYYLSFRISVLLFRKGADNYDG